MFPPFIVNIIVNTESDCFHWPSVLGYMVAMAMIHLIVNFINDSGKWAVLGYMDVVHPGFVG